MTDDDQDEPPPQPMRPQRKQGVLWKRRDVFRTKWRPRWFVLQPEEAVLTYYLLSRSDAAASATISTPLRRASNNGNSNMGAYTAPPVVTTTRNPSMHSISNVSDVTMTDMQSTVGTVSENPVDYDVVPRGAIYLAGCQVSVNDTLSRPAEGLFAFTIEPPSSDPGVSCHLAARTEESRTAWVETLSAICRDTANDDNDEDEEDSNGAGETGGSRTRGSRNNNNNGVASPAMSSSITWKSLSPPETLFDHVPPALAAMIEQSLESHLDLCEDEAPSLQWTPVLQDRDGVSAYQRQDLHGRTILKSTATLPHHPKQLLNILLDSKQRPNFEPSVECSERLEVLNPNTFLDYYSYKAVWPTAPRDFAVVLHWQALQRKHPRQNNVEGRREEALVTLAFSCPEANELKEPSPPQVRAHLHASFYLLRLIPAGTGSDDSPKCRLTRILSYDLGGSLPRNLSNTVLMQQAKLPAVLQAYLQRTDPSPEPRLTTNDGPLTNECVIRDVVESISNMDNTAIVSGARRRLNFDRNARETVSGGSSAADSDNENDEDVTDEPDVASSNLESYSELPVPYVAAILLSPLLLHRLLHASGLFVHSEIFGMRSVHPSILFCIAAFFAVRFIVIRSLGYELSKPLSHQAFIMRNRAAPTTCIFSVDLKGVLRFIGMKREEKKESGINNQQPPATPNQVEVSVVHIVALALARAMQNHAECWNYRRVNVPILLIDGLFRYPSSSLDISVSMASGRLVTLENFHFDNVQAVASAVSAAEKELHDDAEHQVSQKKMFSLPLSLNNLLEGRPRHGRCLILLTKTDSEDDNQRSNDSSDVAKVEITQTPLPHDLDVLVVVGSVRLERNNSAVGSPRRPGPPPKPILSLSLTVNTASVLDTGKCHRFAEELQKLIQFPELCDD